MEFIQNDSLEVDAILERIRNKLSERHSDSNSFVDERKNIAVGQNLYSSPVIKKPLLLDDSQTNDNNTISIRNPNIIPNPLNDTISVKDQNNYYDEKINQNIIDLTPNMEIHSDIVKQEGNSIDINLSNAEYSLLIEVLSKRFSKAFCMTKLQPKIEKWLDINLKDLLVSK